MFVDHYHLRWWEWLLAILGAILWSQFIKVIIFWNKKPCPVRPEGATEKDIANEAMNKWIE